jgi:hypothetical protein
MRNFLKKFEDNGDNFFVAKSYLTVGFEYDRKKPEFSIFYIKKNSSPDAYHREYKDLKVRKMNRKEIEYFKGRSDEYLEIKVNDKGEDFSEEGTVYHLRSNPFDKTKCKTYRQFSLNL